MKWRAARASAGILATLAIAGAIYWWVQHDRHTYLTGATADFVAIFAPPPAPDSSATRRELDELLALQGIRTPGEVATARADRKTEIQRFYGALGFPEGANPDLPLLRGLAESVEDDTRPYVRAAKEKFRRLRPYEVEPRIEPCIDHVRGDLSYPSGHANYAYVMAELLREMVPERGRELMARADEFARQRMVCGVHYASDIAAGHEGASWLVATLNGSAEFRKDANTAMAELRAALNLPARTLPPG